MSTRVSQSAIVDDSAQLGEDVTVWHFSQIRENVSIGSSTSIGKSVYIGPNVSVGARCKIQNNAQIYEPCVIDDGVFIGPGAVLTNDKNPRAVNPSGKLKSAQDWVPVGVKIGKGASIGANATCVAPIVIGQWALIGAGALVTRDVPQFALMIGVPAKQVGWVGELGEKLNPLSDIEFESPITKKIYRLMNEVLSPYVA